MSSKSNIYCAIPTCRKTKKKDGNLSFHLFPKRPELRQQWMELCQIDRLNKYSTLCSRHFVDYDFFGKERKKRQLKKIAIPSLHLPSGQNLKKLPKDTLSKHMNHQQKPEDTPHKECLKVSLLSIKKEEPDPDFDVQAPTEQPSTSFSSPTSVPPFDIDQELKIIEQERESAISELSSLCVPYKEIVLKNGTEACRHYMTGSKITISDNLVLDQELRAFTGVSLICFRHLIEYANTFRFVSKVYVPQVRDRILICLIKIRLNISFPCLKVLFCISVYQCKLIFRETLQLLSGVLNRAIYWQDRHEILKNLPQCFVQFPRVRIVMDHIIIPGHLNQQLKALFVFTPAGYIVYKSKVEVAKVSDGDMFTDIKLSDKIVPRLDVIMAGESLAIEHECSQMGLELIKPRDATGKGAELCKKISKARVKVDEIIKEVKAFKALSGVSWEMAEFLDDIVTLVAGLVNLNNCSEMQKFGNLSQCWWNDCTRKLS